MIKEAIILAGGFGTRLQKVVVDLPKCLAPVKGVPFLSFLLKQLKGGGVEHFIFSLGYKHDLVEAYLVENLPAESFSVVVEPAPLGTGGAVKLALDKALEDETLVCNGDTLFNADLKALAEVHKNRKAACTLALKKMERFSRYGVVEIDSDQRITRFQEKKYYDTGLINGGVYILNKKQFLDKKWPEQFSFEKDYLEKYVNEERFFGFPQDNYFIDIGIPEDFERAQKELN